MQTMKAGGDLEDLPYYIITKTILRVVGHWPYQSRKEAVLCRIFMYILCTAQVGPQILGVIHNYNDFEFLTEAISSFTTNGVVFVNLITFHVHANTMKSLFEDMKEDWKLFPENNGLHILHNSSSLGKKLSILYSGSLYAAAIIFITEPLYLRIVHFFIKSNDTIQLTFAIPVDYGKIDIQKYYWILLITCGICILGIVTSFMAADVALFTFALHVCGLFEALGFAIENLQVQEEYEKNDDEYQYQYFRRCIQIHNRVLAFSDRIKDLYTWNFFTVVGLGTIAISVTAIQVVFNLNAMQKLIKMLLYAIADVFHLFVQCFTAQRIFDTSLNINQCIMNSKWYHSKPKTKKLLRFMIMRSQIPCQLTAGKVMFMSLNSFTVLMKTAASYFTVFLNMQ